MNRFNRVSAQCARRSFSVVHGLGPLLLLALLLIIGGCRDSESPAPSVPSQPKELVFYGFAEDMPLSILDDFTREFGITVRYRTYQSPEEAEDSIRQGQPYDVVLIEHQTFPALIQAGLLADLNHARLPNFKYISANFRDLTYDPGNRHSIPASYGTTGLIVRTDLVGAEIRRWADLWQPRFAGKIGLRAQPREIIGLTLRSLGYGFDSENPAELDAVRQRLLALKQAVTLLAIESDDAVAKLLSGEIAILHGYAEDYRAAREHSPQVAYILPEEGTALWSESYAILARSRNREAAEQLLNFLLRPEITARIIREKQYAQPNDAALNLLPQELRDDPVVFPSNRDLANCFLIQPLSPQGKILYTNLWAGFLANHP
jgi:spermidine/putrescine transport system substrate-binding protein